MSDTLTENQIEVLTMLKQRIGRRLLPSRCTVSALSLKRRGLAMHDRVAMWEITPAGLEALAASRKEGQKA